ncbi:MAG: hypothetical protein GDA43_15235 [Hormoscilla sp. SP5CHS1]|nr:hypothetical protein [Hormoscilla sp. SP12CHS1]MBC6454382.1 hypothetical protein [Hormoscilla sp. SP5CHS1]
MFETWRKFFEYWRRYGDSSNRRIGTAGNDTLEGEGEGVSLPQGIY